MTFDINKDIKRRAAAYRLQKRINWDQPEGIREGMKPQLFKSTFQNMYASVSVHQHIICMAIIYGMENDHMVDYIYGITRHTFSGFKQKYGRMPTSKDNIVILAGKYYFSNVHQNEIQSTINWELK